MSALDQLVDAEWRQRAETQAIFAALGGAEGLTRAVGGVVRDTLLGRDRDNPDIDMATELTPDTVIARAEAAGIAHYPTGILHGTVTLKLGGTLAEVTTLRRDIETDGRHAVVAFGTDWTADAARRDFTLNALYCDADGTLFDPLGGAHDALAGRVRFIGDAGQRIAEDGLRVYRFFRFSASHGGERFDPDGLAACQAAVGALDHLSAERIGAEMLRMLDLPDVARTLAVMHEIGLLAVDEDRLRALVAYEEIGGGRAVARLAILCEAAALQERWRLSNEIVAGARRIEAAAGLLADGKVGEAAYRFGETAVDGLAVAAAVNHWSRDLLAETARELGHTVVGEFPVSGGDLKALGIAPGPRLGAELARLERAWIDSGFTLGQVELLAMVRG